MRFQGGARQILDKLHQNGFEAYVVGGCVRDSLMGVTPKDWDICTSATPQQAEGVLFEHSIIETGIKHGTITVLSDGVPYEVTTFRVDGAYSDNRRPDEVHFVSNLKEDLSRRDFTINAMAYSDQTGLVGPFGGEHDIGICVLRCVGSPDERFEEDALRIMRALRFASTYGLLIEKETAAAIHRNAWRLGKIAVERINVELCKMLCGKNVLNILLDYSDVVTTIIPEMRPCIGFEQNNRYHQYTVYDHIAHAVANYHGNDVSVKIALLLHDIGKPLCYTEDENGGHFHGHAVPSHDLSEIVLNRLRFDNKTKTEVLDLVLYHDSVIEPTPKTARRWLNKIGEDRLKQLIEVRHADIQAHADGTQESRLKRLYELVQILTDIILEQQCFQLKDLKINGRDIMSLGVQEGRRVGEILDILLEKVIAEEINNDHDSLMGEAARLV